MNFTKRGARTIPVLLAAFIFGHGLSLSGQSRVDTSARNAPIVRLSPESAYVMEPVAGKKLVMVLEIVDVSGAGIKANRSGMPQFIDPSRNVSLFVSEVVARGTYVDSNGQEVTQIISLIPVDKLVREEKMRASPPFNIRHIRRPTEGERTIIFPDEAMIPFAELRFQVEDLQGNRSSPDAGVFDVGFASNIFEPSE